MLLEHITGAGALPGLVTTLSFTEARHRVIAHNIANWGNPNHRTRHLDAQAFQAELGRAFGRRGPGRDSPLELNAPGIRTDRAGRLHLEPTEQPPENLLFHDGTNMSIERQMSDLAENAMMHEAASTLLRNYYDGLRKAIRGQV